MPDADPASRSTILIRNGYVIPGAHRAHLDRADIFIEQDRIAAVGPDLRKQATIATTNPRIIEAGKRIVIPGFINAHTHSAGVNVALGTDGTSTSDRADMLRSLGMAALIHRVGDMDYETWVTAEEAFEMATIGSAGSTGLADDIGTIEVRKKADLVLLDREDTTASSRCTVPSSNSPMRSTPTPCAPC